MFNRIMDRLAQQRGNRSYEKISSRTAADPEPKQSWIMAMFSPRANIRKSNRRVDDEGPAPMPQIRGMQGMLRDLELAVQRGVHCWNMTQMKDSINSMEFFFNQVKDNYDQLERLKDQQLGKPTQAEIDQTSERISRVLEKDDYSHNFGRLNEGRAPDQTPPAELKPTDKI